MNWTIYSIGDAAYLEAIFNGLANIVSANSFTGAIEVAFLIGIIIVCLQALFNGGREIEWHVTLLAWIVFTAMFVPTVSVSIEDAYSAQVRQVDNVPLGPVAIGTILSNAGYELTKLMEQAFGRPSNQQITTAGFGSRTSLLANVRRDITKTASWSEAHDANQGSDTNLAASWENYVADCTMTAWSLYRQNSTAAGAKPSDAILRKKSLPNALRFSSDNYTTKIYLNGTKVVTCENAWNQLEPITTGSMANELFGVVASSATMPGTQLDEQPTANDVQNQLNAALTAYNKGGIQAQRYVAASALLPAFQAGVKQYHYDYREMMQAAQVNEAIMQRNSQWKAQESVFESTIRPLMTFMEGLFYAIAPIVAFFIPMGRFGLQLAPKFLALAVWIQLWLPLLAIVNLYQTMVLEQQMTALSGVGSTPITSIAGLMKLDQILQSWIATGSMLASSVPILAALVAYGGNVFMMSRLMGQMQGGEHVDPGVSTPEVANNDAAIEHTQAYNSGINKGITQEGTNQAHQGFSVSQALSKAEQSTEQQAQQSQQQFQQALTSSSASTYTDSTSVREAQSISEKLGGQESQTWKSLSNQSQAFQELAQENSEAAHALVGSLQANGGLEGQLGNKLAGKLAGQYSLQDKESLSSSTSEQESMTEQIQAVLSQADTAELNKSVAQDHTQSEAVSNAYELSQSDARQISQQAQETVSAQQAYQETEAMVSQYQSSQNIDADQLSHMLTEGDNLAELESAAHREGVAKEAQAKLESESFSGMFPDPEQAAAAAHFEALAENGHGDEIARILGFSGTEVTPQENEGVGAAAQQAEGTQQEVQSDLQHQDTRQEALHGKEAEGETEQAIDNTDPSNWDEKVQSHFDNAMASTQASAAENDAWADQNMVREAERNLTTSQPDLASAGIAQQAQNNLSTGLWSNIAGLSNLSLFDAAEQGGEAASQAEGMGSIGAGLAASLDELGEQWSNGAVEQADVDKLHEQAQDRAQAYGLSDTQADFFADATVQAALEASVGESALGEQYTPDTQAVQQEFVQAGFSEEAAAAATERIAYAANVDNSNAEAALAPVHQANDAGDIADEGSAATFSDRSQ